MNAYWNAYWNSIHIAQATSYPTYLGRLRAIFIKNSVRPETRGGQARGQVASSGFPVPNLTRSNKRRFSTLRARALSNPSWTFSLCVGILSYSTFPCKVKKRGMRCEERERERTWVTRSTRASASARQLPANYRRKFSWKLAKSNSAVHSCYSQPDIRRSVGIHEREEFGRVRDTRDVTVGTFIFHEQHRSRSRIVAGVDIVVVPSTNHKIEKKIKTALRAAVYRNQMYVWARRGKRKQESDNAIRIGLAAVRG